MPAYKSPQRTAQDTGDKPRSIYTQGKLFVMSDTATATVTEGAAVTVEFDFPRLQPGRVIVFPALSYIVASDMEANADLHLGHRAYLKSDGTTEVADDNEFMDNVDIGGGAIDAYWTAVTGFAGNEAVREFDAQDGLQIYVTIDTGDITVGDTIQLVVVYAVLQ